MKKIMTFTLFVALVFVSGCIEQPKDDIEPTINHSKVNEVVNLINVLHLTITDEDRENIELIRDKYDALSDEEKALIHNYDAFIEAEQALALYDEAKEDKEIRDQKYNDVFTDIETTLRALVPTNIYDNISLPQTVDTILGEARLLWTTSDPFTLSTFGDVIPGRKDKLIELSTTIILDEYRYTFTQNTIVKPLTFAPLPTENLVFAYTFGTAHGISDLEKQTFDVINHCFASISNGRVVAGSLQNRRQILALRKDEGIRVVFSILGYGQGAIPFSEAARTEESRFIFAQSIVEQVVKYHYDGVDIDWEYPGFQSAPGIDQPTDTRNYTLLIAEIHRQLKAVDPDYLLTAAVPGGRWNPSRYDIASINEYLDFFHLMTYDMDSFNTSTHHTALYSSSFTPQGSSVKETVDLYIQGGASPEKLIIGAAFYGREFTLSNTGSIMSAASSNRASISYTDIVGRYLSKIEEGTVTRYWDDDAKAPYLHNSQTNTVVVYDDYESIQYKIEYLKSAGLGGIMFWQFSQDTTRTLVQSINDNLKP